MTTAALTAGLERIPDQLGYLVISEDGVLASAGELENDEHTAGVMMQMVRTASRFRLPGSAEPPFKRMSEFWRRLNITDYMELPASHVQLLATHLRRIFSTRVRMSAHRYSDVRASPELCSSQRDYQVMNRCTVILEDFVYTVTVSGQKVFVVKRQNNQQEPINV